jgi:hypothetical protein
MWCVCPRRGDRKVSLQICVGVCETANECAEFKEVSSDEIEKARAALNKLPAPLSDTVDTVGDVDDFEGALEAEVDDGKPKENESSVLLTRALAIKTEIESKFWEMGGILNTIFKHQYYVDYGYRDWKDFCDEVLEMKWRTATYLRDIYVKFTSLGVKPEECIGVGWGRLKELLPIVNKENVKYWIGEAKKKNASVASLNVAVRLALGRLTKEEAESMPTLLSFRFSDAQLGNVERALELARRITGSGSRNYQLEMICAEFRVTYEAVEDGHPRLKIATDLLGKIEALLDVKFEGELIDGKTGEIAETRKS